MDATLANSADRANALIARPRGHDTALAPRPCSSRAARAVAGPRPSRPSLIPEEPRVGSALPACAGKRAPGQVVDGAEGAAITWSTLWSIGVVCQISGHAHCTRGIVSLFESVEAPRIAAWWLPGGAR